MYIQRCFNSEINNEKALDGNEICDKFLHLAATLYEVA